MELKNEFIQAKFKTYGGELISLKSIEDNLEYLWIGDEKYWPGQAPTLFPIVGRVKSGIMNQHGFARRMEHTLINKTEDSLSFSLSFTPDTLKVYPYKFQLNTKYILKEKTLTVLYTVKNLDDKDIYFSIGAHPGFNVPLTSDEAFEDYYLEFSNTETASIYPVDLSCGFIISEPKEFLRNETTINLTHDLFKNDALVFNDLSSNAISIKSRKSSRKLTMHFEGFPWFGIWSKPSDAPFVCLEPWYGHSDFTDFNGEFHEKDGIQKLKVGEDFNCSFKLEL